MDLGIRIYEVGYGIEVEETLSLSAGVYHNHGFLDPLGHGLDLFHYALVAECYRYSFRGVSLVLSVYWLPQLLYPHRSRQKYESEVMAQFMSANHLFLNQF